MADSFTKSQVYRTNPSPYDQILVLSQATLNNQLQNMYNLAPDDSPLLKYHLDLRDGQFLHANLGPPRISLQVNSQESVQLYYYLEMQSGTMKLYRSMSQSDKSMKDFDVSGWVIAIPVKISRKIIKKDDTEFAYYASKAGFKDSVFSIAQLYIDASTSAIYEKSKSSFRSVDWSKETAAIRTNFGVFMSQWMSETSENKTNVIGITILATDANTVNATAPTFVPTSIDYYNYAWHDPKQDPSGTKKVDDLDQNALCYLTMSDFAKPPEPVGLTFSGVFVDKGADKGAILCMNSRLFWDRWLLPLLKGLSQKLQLVPTEPYLDKSNDKKWDTSTAAKSDFGANANHRSPTDSYFDWTKSSSQEVSWNWNGGTLTSEKTSYGNSGLLWKASESATSRTNVSFDVGGQKIAITGSNEFHFQICCLGTNSMATLTTNTKWHINFALGSVNDGGLQITRVPDPPGVHCASTTVKKFNQLIWNIPYEEFVNRINNWITTYLENHIGWLRNDLITALQHQHKLFLPASGVFLMQDPRFNQRGDLFVTLHYNGALAPLHRMTNRSLQNKMSLATNYHKLPDDEVTESLELVPEHWTKLPSREALVPQEHAWKEAPPFSLPTITAHA